jgi:hypothetical protein
MRTKVWVWKPQGTREMGFKVGVENIIKTDGTYKNLSVCVLGLSG